jgi:hypothetical protein
LKEKRKSGHQAVHNTRKRWFVLNKSTKEINKANIKASNTRKEKGI